jgi:hypothetical protein
VFPSTAWFEKLAIKMQVDEESYRELGNIDCTMVVRVEGLETDSGLYELVFGGFGVTSVRRLGSLGDASPGHFVLSAPASVWIEMIENIRNNNGPDLAHTLNFLTFPDDPMLVGGPDQLDVDAFYRFNESLQRFINASSEFSTTYLH